MSEYKCTGCDKVLDVTGLSGKVTVKCPYCWEQVHLHLPEKEDPYEPEPIVDAAPSRMAVQKIEEAPAQTKPCLNCGRPLTFGIVICPFCGASQVDGIVHRQKKAKGTVLGNFFPKLIQYSIWTGIAAVIFGVGLLIINNINEWVGGRTPVEDGSSNPYNQIATPVARATATPVPVQPTRVAMGGTVTLRLNEGGVLVQEGWVQVMRLGKNRLSPEAALGNQTVIDAKRRLVAVRQANQLGRRMGKAELDIRPLEGDVMRESGKVFQRTYRGGVVLQMIFDDEEPKLKGLPAGRYLVLGSGMDGDSGIGFWVVLDLEEGKKQTLTPTFLVRDTRVNPDALWTPLYRPDKSMIESEYWTTYTEKEAITRDERDHAYATIVGQVREEMRKRNQ